MLFVGRERELATFHAWLGSGSPSLLNVTGPGGVGKTTLLAAFERAVARPSVHVDGRAVLPTPEDFLAALGHRDAAAAAAELGGARALLAIDAFELLGELTRFLREDFLPALDPDVRVVVAGRHPLGAWVTGEQWPLPIRSLALEGLDRPESAAYLVLRGVEAPELRDQILATCGDWPLALSLAADLVEQFDVAHLPAAPEWHLAVQSLVERLLDEAADPALRRLLEAGSIVRRFDEETLEALTGEPPGAAFAALCRLSVVRPTARGLALHDDVRRLVADDLRWRRPAWHAELRTRAIRHLHDRAERAEAEERERLLEERLFLWGHEVVRALLYADDDGGEVWVEPGRPADRDELLALHDHWQTVVRPALGLTSAAAPWDAEAHARWFGELVSTPAARVRIARDRSGEALGYDVVLPVSAETAALVRGHEVIASTVDAYLELPGSARPAANSAATELVFLAHLGLAGRLPEATRGALIRDLLSVLARGGVCLCSLDLEEYRRLADLLGFRPVRGSESSFRGDAYLGYALDLRHVGPEPWLQALLAQRPLPPVGPGELEQELRAVLAGWHDDRRLAASSLTALVEGDGAAPDAVRALVRIALERARTTHGADREPSLRAIELAYLDRSGSHERAADELHVSRATFYRLLTRGVGLLAESLTTAS